MNHIFLPSQSDPLKCGDLSQMKLCNHSEIAHSDKAECDHCDYVGRGVELDANGDLACPKCINLVVRKEIINTSIGAISINDVLRKSREIDQTVQLTSDIFNLETVAITDIIKSVRADDSISNKPNTIASILWERINHFQKVIFERSEQNKNDNTRQRAYQVELNKIANELRAEEREKYRLIDINYKPRPPKEEVKVKKISVKKKIDKVELREAAKELGIGEFAIQALCVARNITVEDAKQIIRVNMQNAKLMVK